MNLTFASLRRRRRLLLEVFLAGNLLFLAVDIFFAHSVNSFREPLEWLPLWFSLAGGLVLFGLLGSGRGPDAPAMRWAGGVIGALSVEWGCGARSCCTSKALFSAVSRSTGLSIAAPFRGAARLRRDRVPAPREPRRPLPRSRGRPGLGPAGDAFAASGFAGNFVLSLLDHEQNGFRSGPSGSRSRRRRSRYRTSCSSGSGGRRRRDCPPRRPDAAAPGRGRPPGASGSTSKPASAPSAGSPSRRSSTAPRRSRHCCSPTWRSSPDWAARASGVAAGPAEAARARPRSATTP